MHLSRLSWQGEDHDIPEIAFYMVGGIEDVVAKAEKLAAEAK